MIEKRAEAVISTENLRKNYKYIKSLAGSAEVISVVKAEAYGNGALNVCRVLEEEGCRIFAVATADEGIELRENGIKSDILILGVTPAIQAGALTEYNFIQTVNSYEYADELNRGGGAVRCHIKADTGMSRLGLYCHREEDIPKAAEEIAKINSLKNIHIEGMFTHFACSDEKNNEMTQKQFSLFCALRDKCRGMGIKIPLCHCCNSAAILSRPEMHLDAVRAGIILYGLTPDGSENENLSPITTLVSRVSQITSLKKGDTVSYGAAFTAEKNMKIAAISIGYADGLPRLLSGKADVLLRGKRARVVGKICMDMCMVDVTDIPCSVGDEAEIFGNGISLNELAEKMGTINYELLCSVKNRVPRRYI